MGDVRQLWWVGRQAVRHKSHQVLVVAKVRLLLTDLQGRTVVSDGSRSIDTCIHTKLRKRTTKMDIPFGIGHDEDEWWVILWLGVCGYMYMCVDGKLTTKKQ
jgi:hypothetical protein